MKVQDFGAGRRPRRRGAPVDWRTTSFSGNSMQRGAALRSRRSIRWRAVSRPMFKEWARSADDILWRRSKLGLHLSAEEQEALRQFMTPDAARGKRQRVRS